MQKGDNLYSIAKRYNTTEAELMRLNNLTSNLLQIGQVLKVPVLTPPTPPITPPVEPPTDEYITYVVKKGDNLYAIARTYGTTEAELLRINNLTSNALSIGQVLKIPNKNYVPPTIPPTPETPNETYITYTVQKGDNLYALARKYETTEEELMRINNLTSNALSIGQVLKIPVKKPTSPEAPDANYIEYVVKKGDNLYAIARTYGTTEEVLLKINNLPNDSLQIGQVLVIPVSSGGGVINPPQGEYLEYTVVKGDNLYAIAKKYNVSEEALMKYNNLTNNLLQIGQVIRIPLRDQSLGFTLYTVVKGDSLYSIAKKFNKSVDEIKKLNGLTDNLLKVGQVLKIPN